MAATTYEYTTLDRVLGVLAASSSTPTNWTPAQKARLTELIQAASAEVNNECGRIFVPVGTVDAPVTRYFDAPTSPILEAPDLQHPVSLTLAGQLLAASDWTLLPYNLVDPELPVYHKIRRLTGGYALPWMGYWSVGLVSPYGAVAIAGVWGPADVPTVVTQITTELTIHNWSRELAKYGSTAGSAGRGRHAPEDFWTDEQKRRLDRQRLKAPLCTYDDDIPSRW